MEGLGAADLVQQHQVEAGRDDVAVAHQQLRLALEGVLQTDHRDAIRAARIPGI